MLTRDEFLAGMRKGWEQLEWCNGHFYANGPLDASGVPITWRKEETDPITSACAIGAYAASQGLFTTREILYQEDGWLTNDLRIKITYASNNAGSKDAAIRAVEAIEWPS